MSEQLYKINNGNLITPPTIGVRYNGRTVTGYNKLNRDDLLKDGWKPLVIEEIPENDNENPNESYTHYFIEKETEIIKSWKLVIIESEEIIESDDSYEDDEEHIDNNGEYNNDETPDENDE